MTMDDSDLSFASILLGFRQTGDPSLVDLGNAKKMMEEKESIKYAGNGLYEDRPAIPPLTSTQRPETNRVITARSRDTFPHRDQQNIGYEDDNTSQNSQNSQRKVLYVRNFTDQQLQKLARGRYKCSRCGALKTNHDCAMVEQLEGSSGTQVEKVFLTPDEFYGTPAITKMFCFSSSSHDGLRGRPSMALRTITVRRQTPSFSFHSPPLSSKMKSIPDYASLSVHTDNDDDDHSSFNSDRDIYDNNNNNNNSNNNNMNKNTNINMNNNIMNNNLLIKKEMKNKMVNQNIENYYIINPDINPYAKKRVKYESL